MLPVGLASGSLGGAREAGKRGAPRHREWRPPRVGARPVVMSPRHLVVLIAFLAAACASATTSTPPGAVAPRGAAAIPSGPIDLGGDWKRSGPDAVSQRFSGVIARRYGEGMALTAAVGDLRANQFTCARPPAGKAGDPPDQVCRRTQTEAGCTHTWQAHLWDDAGAASAKLTRVRGLYDRRCASDGGLLGGPG